MATWEPKMPSFHDTSIWSLKSAADIAAPWPHISSMDSSSAAAAAVPDPLSKSLLNALSSPHTSGKSPSRGQFSTASSNSNNQSILDNQNEAAAASGAYHRSTSLLLPSRTDTTYGVTSSTAVATTGTGSGNKSSSSMLNASASIGGTATKVTKKRARASRKPPTTVLEADSSNFRAMVQQLTGIPAVPFMSSTMQHHPQRSGLEFLDLVRPPTRSLIGFGAGQGLPPLDPSSLLPSLSRGQPHLHSDTGFAASPYFKYMSTTGTTPRPSSMGDFLRTPLDELGLDQNSSFNSLDQQQQEQQQQQQQQPLGASESCLSMPLLWDGAQNPRDLQLDEMSKYKLANSRPEAAGNTTDGADDVTDQEGSGSRMAHIVDSWLSHADQSTDKH